MEFGQGLVWVRFSEGFMATPCRGSLPGGHHGVSSFPVLNDMQVFSGKLGVLGCHVRRWSYSARLHRNCGKIFQLILQELTSCLAPPCQKLKLDHAFEIHPPLVEASFSTLYSCQPQMDHTASYEENTVTKDACALPWD